MRCDFPMACVGLGLIGGLSVAPGIGQAWPDANGGFTGLQHSAIAWGDFDKDGDLDLLATGWASRGVNEPTTTALYRNDSGAFVGVSAGFPALQHGAVAWGDYDRDGDLDLAIAGQTDVVSFSRRTLVYRNDNGAFVDISAGIPGVNNASLSWGDYDNDGDLDLLVTGWTGAARLCAIYRNSGGSFVDAAAGMTGVNYGRAAWVDYDNDGDLDVSVCGWAGGSTRVMAIYRNDAGAFSAVNLEIPGVKNGSLAWGDMDNDGDLDLLLSGYGGTGGFGVPLVFSRIYANNGGAFTDALAGLEGADGRGGVEFCSNAWGDYDNDGLTDVIVAGWCQAPGIQTRVSRILHNNGDSLPFTDISAGLGAVQYSSVAWADYDNDGDLDIVVSGQVGGADWEQTRLFRNNVAITQNTPPTAPGNLSASVSGSDIIFTWTAALDAQTPQGGLSYNLRVGNAPGTDNIFPAMANLTTGYRHLPAIGNAQKQLSWKLKNINRPVYWSVQAIDGAFAGGEWASEALVP
ncbi:MAG: VCBS repeat-containing protein [Phycisphaerales bacterium]|nr:VCBS repeat-containing protein [Phycisphaerales bacterium]